MMLVKIMDEVNEKPADKKTGEENQKNIIEENVKRITGKKRWWLEARNFEVISRSVYWSWKIGTTISHAVEGELNYRFPCT